MADDPSHEPIVEILRRYLRTHPNAFDSARGIAEWWLADLPGRHDPCDVEHAIERLAAEGLLKPVSIPAGGVMWRAVPQEE